MAETSLMKKPSPNRVSSILLGTENEGAPQDAWIFFNAFPLKVVHSICNAMISLQQVTPKLCRSCTNSWQTRPGVIFPYEISLPDIQIFTSCKTGNILSAILKKLVKMETTFKRNLDWDIRFSWGIVGISSESLLIMGFSVLTSMEAPDRTLYCLKQQKMHYMYLRFDSI